MLWKLCKVGTAALLYIQASAALAIEPAQDVLKANASLPTNCSLATACVDGSPSNVAATPILQASAASIESAKTAMQVGTKDAVEADGSALVATRQPFLIEHPALALLAVAVISMAALSRRDRLIVPDRNP